MSMLEESLENSFAIIGDEDLVMGFSAFGFKTYVPKDREDFSQILEEVVRKKSAICLVQDDIYRQQEAQINSFKHLAIPSFIPFSKEGHLDLMDEIIKNIRIKATGAF